GWDADGLRGELVLPDNLGDLVGEALLEATSWLGVGVDLVFGQHLFEGSLRRIGEEWGRTMIRHQSSTSSAWIACWTPMSTLLNCDAGRSPMYAANALFGSALTRGHRAVESSGKFPTPAAHLTPAGAPRLMVVLSGTTMTSLVPEIMDSRDMTIAGRTLSSF